MVGALEHYFDVLQTQGLSRDLKPMNTPAPEWTPAQCRLIYPSWVQRKAVTVCKRDQTRGGTGNVQQYRLAIHDAVLASEGRRLLPARELSRRVHLSTAVDLKGPSNNQQFAGSLRA